VPLGSAFICSSPSTFSSWCVHFAQLMEGISRSL
jgi:hypothetical protein